MRILGPHICEESQASSPLKAFDKMPKRNFKFLKLFSFICYDLWM